MCEAMLSRRGLFHTTWSNFQNLAIVSFHDPAGAVINNTTVARNPALLLQIISGPVVQCCQQNVHFVHVTCTIDFTGLVTVPNLMTLRIGFYIKLLQITITMVNGNNVAYNLTTWLGVADLSTLTSAEVRAQIFEPCLQEWPIALHPANFNLGGANINTTAIMETIHAKILRLGFKQMCTSIFKQLCLSYSIFNRCQLAPMASP